MPVPRADSPVTRAGLVAAFVLGLWSLTARPASMPPIWPLGAQPAYSSLDAPALIWLEPVLHAAWLTASGSPLPWLGPPLVVLAASAVAIGAGATSLAAAGVLGALVLDRSFGEALGHGAGATMAVGLVWLAACVRFGAWRPGNKGTWWPAVAAAVLCACAVWFDWKAVIAWPGLWALSQRTGSRVGPAVWLAATLAAAAVALVAHFASVAGAAGRLAADLAEPITWRAAVLVAFDGRASLPPGSFVAPELSAHPGWLLLMLALVGILFGLRARAPQRAVLASIGLAAAFAVTWPEWRAEMFLFGSWMLAPMAAVGLTWVARQGRGPALVTAALALIAICETLVLGARPLTGSEARVFRDVLQDALELHARAAAVVLVAEDTRVDSALVPWMAARDDVGRVVQDGAAVARLRQANRAVLAGPVGRRHLELSGVSFADAAVIADPAPFVLSEVDGTFRCVSVRADRWSHLPGIEFTGRLGIEVPARVGGELHLVVGDTLPLPLHAATPDGRALPLQIDPLLAGPGAAAPPADYWFDGGSPDLSTPWVRRVRLAADGFGPTLVSFDFGRRAPRVIARLIGFDDEARGRVCAAPVGVARLQAPGVYPVALSDQDAFGAGWYGQEGSQASGFRWANLDAVVLVRSAVRTAVEVGLDASPAVASGDGGATTLTLRVNGLDIGTRAMATGSARYAWRVPAGVWVAGTNELWWRTSRAVRPVDAGGTDPRSLALRVTGITLTRE